MGSGPIQANFRLFCITVEDLRSLPYKHFANYILDLENE